MADVQEKVVKKNERNVVARAFYAKSDKDAIAAWKQEFSKILQIFQVRPLTFVWHSLTGSFQTELAVNTHVEVTGGRREVADLRQEVTSMRQEVTYMHQDVLVIKEGTSNKQRSVCQTCSSPTKEC